jgi:uncharacterized cupredoxin-like copper-binding protein
MLRFKTLVALVCAAAMVVGVFSSSALAAGGKHARSHAKHKPAKPHAKHKPVVVKIKVSAGEFFFKFSRPSVKAGSKVIFTVVNKGQVAHDLSFTTLHKKTPLIQPGNSKTLTVLFAKKGSFPYICTVPRHAEAGMAGTFVVK